MSKLTRAEKNAIIINESRGIQHPDYYCCTTKKGTIQVRKRKTPLTISQTQNESNDSKEQNIETETKKVDQSEDKSHDSNYESVTNKQLLEKMLTILEKNVVNRDENLNDVEREKVTDENRKFVDNIKDSSESLTNEVKPRQKQVCRVVRRCRKLL